MYNRFVDICIARGLLDFEILRLSALSMFLLDELLQVTLCIGLDWSAAVGEFLLVRIVDCEPFAVV